ARLEHQHLEARVGGDPVGQHAAGRAGADDNVIVFLHGTASRLLAAEYRGRGLALIVNFVLELPARRDDRHRLGHADQDAAVPFERTRPEIEDLAEQLRAAAIVLVAPRRETAECAGLAVDLEAGRDHELPTELHRQVLEPRLPRPQELRPAGRVPAQILFDEKVDGIAEPPEILAQHRAERSLVGVALEQRMAVLGEKTGIEPVLAALSELEQIFRRDLTEIGGAMRARVALELEFEFRLPPGRNAVFELAGEAFFGVLVRIVVNSDIADMLDGQLAFVDVRRPDFE